MDVAQPAGVDHRVLPLENTIQTYAWGSLTAIPHLLGVAPSGAPQAELWMGAHPQAPSRIPSSDLATLIAGEPEGCLGLPVSRRFSGRLPFLLKVLAASKPLSLQAHPSLEQARRGFAREQALGLALSAPNRNYKDPNHKPELICALTPFRALCGFRPFAETKAWLNALNLAALRALSASTLPKTVEHIMTLPPEGARHLVDAIAFACRTSPVRGFEKESAVIANLALAYPGDVGVLGAMLLNFVELQPTEALALGAGNLHAYLDGTGIELMANSDNVLRGGLTNKHIDVPELMSVLDFTEGPATKLRPSEETEAVYQTDFPDFRLSRIDVTAPLRLARLGPDILLCTEGAVDVNGFALRRGASAFARYDEGPLELSGRGTLFRATVHE